MARSMRFRFRVRRASSSSSSSLPFSLVLIAVFLELSLITTSDAFKDGLYSTEDDVVPLNNATLMSRAVRNPEKIVWVVEFYNSWCGHCINFAPTWKELASSLKGWSELVRIAALDCSQSINLEACRKFEINKYPSIKMFSPRSEKGQIMRPLNSRDIDPMTSTIVGFLTEFALPSWPHLQPLASIEDIWSEKKDHHKYVALIFEESTSLVGRKVLMDMRNTPNVLVRTMLKESVAKYGVTQFPSLYEINEDSAFRLLAIGSKMAEQDRQLFVKMLQVLSRGDGDKLDFSLAAKKKKKDALAASKEGGVVVSEDNKYSNGDPSQSLTSSRNESLRVSMQDLESALHYGFRQEIAICKTIEDQKFNALQKFIQVLLKYFPGRGPIMRFLRAVSDMLASVTSSRLSGEEWITKIDDLQNSESFLPEVIEWDCCKGSMPRYRGYPCAMWTLFHVLTVSAYAQQGHSGRRGNPLEVPIAIRGYMDHFFGCAECSKHFLSMAASIEKDITDVKGAVLWFWTAHNKVNTRLKGDQSEDKAFPKVQFPPPSLCKKCHSTQETNTSEPVWNEEIVFKFLVSFYMEKHIHISPELSQRGMSSTMDDTNVAVADGTADNSTLQEAAKSLSPASRVEELDWWEGKQREQDLKKVRWLRERKKEKEIKNKQTGNGAIVSRLLAGKLSPLEGRELSAHRTNNDMGRSKGGLFSDLDLSMCVVFYVISTAIILGLYHHFIIRKKTAPCPTNCLR